MSSGPLLAEADGDAHLPESVPRITRRPPGAVPEEDDPGHDAGWRLRVASLPVEDRDGVDRDFVGNFLLEQAPQDALPTDVFTPRLGLLCEDRIPGFLRT